MGDMQPLDSGAGEGLKSGVRRQGVVAGVRIWRYTAWQNGAIVSCPATVGLRLVSDNTDLSGPRFTESPRNTSRKIRTSWKEQRYWTERIFFRGVCSSPRGFG